MKFPKECVSGKPIDLREYELGIINQFTVDDFMGSIEISDFIRPFYIEQSIMQYDEIKKINAPLLTYVTTAIGKDKKLIEELLKSIAFIYKTSEVKLTEIDDSVILLVKKDGKGIANINDKNFHLLSDIMFETLYFEKPKPEEKLQGSPELVKMVKEAEEKYKRKHLKDNIMTFEIMVHDVIHYRNMDYNQIKDWTVWQLKDTFMIEIYKENKQDSYLLATGGNYKVDLKKVKDWKKETKVVHDDVLNKMKQEDN